MTVDKRAITKLMLERQHLINKAGRAGYEKLFRYMQPVQPVYWSCPGDPPRIVHRADFDDYEYNYDQRAERTIFKGRFQGGSIAYIRADELELYAGAYKKDLKSFSFYEQQVYEVLKREGPMNIRIIKEMTGMLVKQITPALHRLQEAFLVFEDQADNEGDRGWYVFENEFPDADLGRFSRAEALRELIMRFLYLNVFAGIDMIKSFYRLPAKDIKEAAAQLVESGLVKPAVIGGEAGFVRCDDIAAIESCEGHAPLRSVYVLHRNDYLVKANEYLLKEKFHSEEYDILQYILVDGYFAGAVLGRFRNGPFDIEDIVLLLPEEEKMHRRDEIISAVYEVNDPERSPVKRYCGVCVD